MLIYFQRKKRNQNYSIEQVFNSIRNELINKILFKIEISPYESGGFLHSLVNAVYANLQQSKVNHVTGDIHYIGIFLNQKRTIQTYHDIGFLNIKPGIKRWLLKKIWLEWPITRCKYITTVSNATRSEILKELDVSSLKIKVIPNPVFNGFKYSIKSFNDDKPVILHFGTALNKNIGRLIYALTYIPCKLVIIGKQNNAIQSQLSRSGIEYSYKSNLSNEQIIEEYKNCDIVSLISTHEGFGLPIIEGQKTGRVIIMSNVSSMPEIAGDGACFVNPFSIEEIRDGFEKIIRDKSYRDGLIAKGLQNTKRFSSERIAEQYLELYKDILNT